jgi:hypothetical protein
VTCAKRAYLTAQPFTVKQLEAMNLFEALVTAEEWAATVQALT